MEVSILVAKIIGLYYVLVGLGLLLNGAYYRKAFSSLVKDSGFMFYGGMMSLLAGFLIVNYHNFWVNDWTVIITVFGWLALIKGALLLLAPNFFTGFNSKIFKHSVVLGVFVLLLGLVFGYFGFCLPEVIEVIDVM
jgi:hypothetical protein